ncbi:hypothetical protein [Nitrosopumilus sp.]|nr:hypothetical protein [Nitrosopumilus sp.]
MSEIIMFATHYGHGNSLVPYSYATSSSQPYLSSDYNSQIESQKDKLWN